MLWPWDWLRPTASTRSTAQVAGYTMDYVQFPGGDFYSDRLEISDGRGTSAMVSLSPDNGKCWIGWTAHTEAQVDFYCFPMGRMATLEVAWLMEQLRTCPRPRCDLSAAWFSRK
jgi:hypothetical protein